MALTQVSGTNVFYESQALSRAAPSVVADGIPLEGLDSVLVMVDSVGATTITGGGIQAYRWDDAVGAWFRFAEMDWTATTGQRRAAVSFPVEGSRKGSRICFCTASLTVSAGTTVTVYTIGERLRGA